MLTLLAKVIIEMGAIPEISLNKLAEFATATKARKQAIVKSIKSPDSGDHSKRQLYVSAKSAICNFMIDVKHDTTIFEKKKIELLSLKPDSDKRKNDIKNSIEAIDHFLKILKKDLPSYLKLEALRGLPKEKRQLKTNGILIHLTPDISFWDKEKKLVGAMKLIFSKGRKITPMEGQIISGMLYKSMRRNYKVDIEQKNYFALDIFSQRLFVTPDSYSYHSRLLKSAFKEINMLWLKK
jgi:Virus-capping methyltransferase